MGTDTAVWFWVEYIDTRLRSVENLQKNKLMFIIKIVDRYRA